MSVALAPVITNSNTQAVTLKSIVLDPELFDGDQMKFED